MPAADARTIWNGLAGDWVRHIRSVPGDEGDMVRRTMLNALILDLAGDCSGKAVLDAGSGDGYLCRLLARQGAFVTGLDVSDRMLDAARAVPNPPAGSVRYARGSVYRWPDDAEGPFDVIVCNMVMNILPDHERAFAALAGRLRHQGRLIVSIVHPAFDDVGGGWLRDDGGRWIWSANRYFERVEGVASSGSPSFHRSLGDYVAAARQAGLAVTALKEPVLPMSAIESLPSDRAAFARIPYFCLFAFEQHR